MSFFRKLLLVLWSIMLVGSLVGCNKEGPAERVGKKIDKAVEGVKEETKEAVKEAGEKI